MILNNGYISQAVGVGDIGIHPYEKDSVGPYFYEVRLGGQYESLFYDGRALDVGGTADDLKSRSVVTSILEPFIVFPGDFLFSRTRETVRLPNNLTVRLEGDPVLESLGLLVRGTGGLLPGCEQTVPLTVFNASKYPLVLRPSMKIGRLVFSTLTARVVQLSGLFGGEADA